MEEETHKGGAHGGVVGDDLLSGNAVPDAVLIAAATSTMMAKAWHAEVAIAMPRCNKQFKAFRNLCVCDERNV